MPRRSAKCGFTLIELVIVIVILGIIVAGGSTIVSDSIRATRGLNALSAGSGDGRAALDRMAREIRSVSYRTTGGDGSLLTDGVGYGFLKAQSGIVQLEKGDASAPTTVQFRLVGSDLVMTLAYWSWSSNQFATPTQSFSDVVLLSGVTNFQLNFYSSITNEIIGSCDIALGATPSGTCKTLRQSVGLVRIAITTSRGTLTTFAELRAPRG